MAIRDERDVRIPGRRSGLIAAFLGLSLTIPVFAQPDRGRQFQSNQEETVPPIARAELMDLSETLHLSEEQADIVNALYDGYDAAYRQAVQEQRDRRRQLFEQARENGDWQSMGDTMRQLGREQNEAIERLETDFFENVQLILTPEQSDRWGVYERLHRRRDQMEGMSLFAGENIDLIQLVNGLELGSALPSSASATLDGYEREVDALLIERERLTSKFEELDWRDPEDQEDMDDLSERLLTNRRRLREANDRHMEALAAQLSPVAGERLREEFRRRAYPVIYAKTPADDYAATVRGREDLSPDQRTEIEAAEATLAREVGEINRRLVALNDNARKAMFDDEGVASNPMMRRMMAGATGGRMGQRMSRWMNVEPSSLFMNQEQDEKRSELLSRKRQVVIATIDRVYGALSLDQQAALPRPEVPEQSDSDRQRDRMRDFMGRMESGEWRDRRGGDRPDRRRDRGSDGP